MAKQKVVRSATGEIIHIGEWDYQREPIIGLDLEKPVLDYERPILDEKGRLTGHHIMGYVPKQIGEKELNPMPDGAYEDEEEIVVGPDGGLYGATNYRGLRSAEYPPIGDQLDALFRAGVFPPEMAEQLAAVKAKYPKSEQ